MAGLKYELDQWNEGVIAFDQGEYEDALEIFEPIADSAKIHFNIGVVLTTLGDFQGASEAYAQATKLDQYLAIAYFQNGVANVALENYSKALSCFHDAYQYLRGNMVIDYTQLGLEFKLFSCQVLYNRALCYVELGEMDQAMSDFWKASREKQTKEHDVVDQALRDKGKDCTIFTVPQGVLYRPPESKVKNSKKKDYLGNSKVIAAIETSDSFSGFQGKSAWQVQMSGPTNVAAVDEPRAMTPPSALQRRGTGRGANGRTRRGTDPERPQLEHSSSFKSQDAPVSRRVQGAGPGPSSLGPAGSEPRLSLLSRRNTDAQRPAPLNLAGQSNYEGTASSTAAQGGEIGSQSYLDFYQDEIDNLDQDVYALTLEYQENTVGDQYSTTSSTDLRVSPVPSRSNSNNSNYNYNNTNNNNYNNNNYNNNNYNNNNYNNNNNGRTGGNPINKVGNGYNGYGTSPPSRTGTPPVFSSELRRIGSENNAKIVGAGLHRDDSVRSAASGGSGGFYQQPNGSHSGYMHGGEGSYVDEPVYASLRDKLRVKCHYIDTRAILVRADTPLQELIQRVQEKFQLDRPLKLKYRDEDQHMLSMVDDEDWLMAQQVHLDTTGSLDRMELWCFDEE